MEHGTDKQMEEEQLLSALAIALDMFMDKGMDIGEYLLYLDLKQREKVLSMMNHENALTTCERCAYREHQGQWPKWCDIMEIYTDKDSFCSKAKPEVVEE